VQGHARHGPGRTILVRTPDGQELTLRAKTILIATGSRPVRPKSVGYAYKYAAFDGFRRMDQQRSR
jgi:pyruvate/2-oxoglutarate dehydrogenase complex dihydrolipoamide dehydrogenase (E3) component